VTQQNAALVEEAAAAAESLEEQAQNLSASVSVFKLDASSSGRAVVAPRSPQSGGYPVGAPLAGAARAAAPTRTAPRPQPKPVASSAADEDEWQEF
jgi:methyl-accepting chemotaxis protein